MTTTWAFKRGAYTAKERRELAQRVEAVPQDLRDLWPRNSEPCEDSAECYCRVEFLAAASAAHRDYRAARRDDPEAPEPSILQAFNLWKQLGEPMKRNTTKVGERKPRSPQIPSTARFVKNGRPVMDTSNVLSSMAYQNTAGIDPATPKRITTDALRALLMKLGVQDVSKPGWKVTLPNGIELALVDETHGKVPVPAKDAKPAGKATPKAAKTPAAKSPKVDKPSPESESHLYKRVMAALAAGERVTPKDLKIADAYAHRTKKKAPRVAA